MSTTFDPVAAGGAHGLNGAGCVYVLRIGTTSDLYKIGKAKDYQARMKAHRTMSVERLTLYAEIETEYYGEIETYLKHLLQGHRWTKGEGRELYQASQHVIDDAVAAAQHRATVVLPRMAEAAAVTAQPSDGTVLTPDDQVLELYRERLLHKQAEWYAKHEGERIDAELKVIMGPAAELAGVATFASGLTPDFDEAGFARDHEDLYQAYQIMRPCRQFKIRW